ncbi:ATP-binding cassette domain-containing protein, partial [Neisseria gonorrhoeae]|uniref:ATP-binding cassette domain-containing protein n=1 Tax=Neisseria gonorrhoeae TaxID=485 RepID=UPI001136C9A4
MTPLLNVKDLRAYYGQVQALHGLSFSLNEGSLTTLLGANGAGKSTTLKAISGLLKTEDGEVTRGEIMFDGARIDGIDPE